MRFIQLQATKDGNMCLINVEHIISVTAWSKEVEPDQGSWITFVDGEGMFAKESPDEIMLKIRG
jgi:hypothetical protein